MIEASRSNSETGSSDLLERLDVSSLRLINDHAAGMLVCICHG
jgi:hypothetical protein